jgi:VCBS repeat-containing protein
MGPLGGSYASLLLYLCRFRFEPARDIFAPDEMAAVEAHEHRPMALIGRLQCPRSAPSAQKVHPLRSLSGKIAMPAPRSGWWLGFLLGGVSMSAPLAVRAQPVAVDDSYATEPLQELTVDDDDGVLANDAAGEDDDDDDDDDDEDDLEAEIVSSTANGTLDLDEDGGFSYVPNMGFTGTDTFTYRATNGSEVSNAATVTITVASSQGNAPPVAVDDAYSVPEGTERAVSAPGVLANDTDPEGAPLTAMLVDDADDGTLTLNADGSFVYTPRAGFAGTDAFRYQAHDGSSPSAPATVTITVTEVNNPPLAVDDSYTTDDNRPLNVNAGNGVLDNDTDADDDNLTAVLVTGASSGTVTLNANGSFRYEPAAGFAGTVTFTYQADDGAARSGTATVTITVSATNDAPTAQPDSYTTAEDTTLLVGGRGVLGNDTDANGDTLTAERVTNVADGDLQLRPDGTFTYRPDANFSGTTSFTYRARDGSAPSAAVTVAITVSPVNDAPVLANAPETTATEGAAYSYRLAASDPDDDTLTIAAPTLPAWLAFRPPATISGTPGGADVGNHDVTMTVADGIAPAVELNFRIAVTGVDSAPLIEPIPEQTATEGSPFDFDLAAFVTDSDTPAADLQYTATRELPPGLALSAAGRLTGTPTVGASVGTHTATFTVADDTTAVPGQMTLVVLAAGRVDLSATISVAPNPVTLDAPASWTITIENRAQVASNGASLETAFVGDVPFLFDAPATPGCTITPSGNQNRLSCTLGALPGNASTSVTVTGRGSFAGDVFAKATVAVAPGGALDETTSNDRAEASLSIAQRIAAAAAQSIALAAASAAAAGDFNGDGFDDLGIATGSPQGLVLLENIADPANPSRRMFATPPLALGGEALASDLVTVDLDRDGDLDIVTAAGSGAPNRAFLNTGGVFTSVSLGDDAVDGRAVAAGDINGDAFVDLVFASSGTSTVLINSGVGAVFTRGSGLGPHAARDALLVDLLGDALPELVLADAEGDAAVYSNSGGAFALATRLPTGPTSAVATGDFNGDGRADLVFARDTAEPPAVPSALVWLTTANRGNPFFVADELGAAAAADLLVNDFNFDSRADVLAASDYGARVFTNAGAANGTFVLHPQQVATPGARGVAMGKFNSDDRVDLAVVGDGVAIFVNDGSGNFGPADSAAPVIQLRGEPTVNVTIDAPYSDAGATAGDPEEGDITSRIVVTNPVNTALLGTYTITYAVSDLAGNAAVPVTRTVNVHPQAGADEGGSGALGVGALALLLAAALSRLRRREGRRVFGA